MQYETSVDINAALAEVWAVLTDVERWPEWTASMMRVQRLDSGTFGVGSKARIKQPGVPAIVWQVTELSPERSFTWETKSAGVTTIATHRLTTRAGDGVTATLAVRRLGFLAPLVGLLTAALTRRYLQMEAQGLKRQSEALRALPPARPPRSSGTPSSRADPRGAPRRWDQRTPRRDHPRL